MKVSPGEHLQICLRMTELISALGLRHVGYGIPTELVGPFANCFVEVLRENAPGKMLRWRALSGLSSWWPKS